MPPEAHVQSATARGKKRRRSSEDTEAEAFPPPIPQWERAGYRSAEEANVTFWDGLSKVPLCRRALGEFDRRTLPTVAPAPAVVASISGPSRPSRPTTRSMTRQRAQERRIETTTLEERAAQLKRFAMRGGPDFSDLRGDTEPSGARSTVTPRETTLQNTSHTSRSTPQARRRTSLHDLAFRQHLIDHGIYPNRYGRSDDGYHAPKPDNWQEIQDALVQPRPSLAASQFSERDFEDFQVEVENANNRVEMMGDAFSTMRGECDIPSAKRRLFENLAPLTDGTIPDAMPDFYHGAIPQQLDARVRAILNLVVVPAFKGRIPILPNNPTEGEGPDDIREVTHRQIWYASALGARSMQHLQSHGQPEPVYDNNAYTIGSLFDGNALRMYVTHPTAPSSPGGKPAYHVNQCRAVGMRDDVETFRQGAMAFRNARDWTRDKRDELIEEANQRVAATAQSESIGGANDDDTISTISFEGSNDDTISANAGSEPAGSQDPADGVAADDA